MWLHITNSDERKSDRNRLPPGHVGTNPGFRTLSDRLQHPKKVVSPGPPDTVWENEFCCEITNRRKDVFDPDTTLGKTEVSLVSASDMTWDREALNNTLNILIF